MSEDKHCFNCGNKDDYCGRCKGRNCGTNLRAWVPIKKVITFPILNNLTPNLHSCTLKVIEEVGELMEKLGKGQGANGEKVGENRSKWAAETVCEAIDTAQSAITLAHTLCKEYGFDLEELMELHESKLKYRGYLK